MLNFHIAPTPSDSPVFPLEGGSPRRMSIVKRYLVAVVIVGVGVLFRVALVPVFGTGITYITLYPAVILSAIFGGLGPGLVAAGLSSLAGFVLLTLRGSALFDPEIDPGEWLRTFVFLGCSALISAVAEVAGRSRRRSEEKAAQLERSNAMLQREAVRRHDVEARLRQSDERFRLATASEAITLFEHNAELRYTWLYPEKPEYAEALGKTDAELLPGAEGQALMERKAAVLATGCDERREVRVDTPQGPRYYDTFISVRRSPTGAIVGVGGAALDITTRKREEENRRRLAAAVEHSHDAIIAHDLNGVITTWNEGATRTFGYLPIEAIGCPLSLLVPADVIAEERDLLRRVLNGERIDHFETRRKKKDGTEINVSLTISPIRNDRGEIVGASKISREITHRVRREQTARVLSLINSRIVGLDDADEIVRQTSEVVGHHLGAQRCYFAEWDEAMGHLIVTNDWHEPGEKSFVGRHELSAFGPSEWRQKLEEGMAVTDVETDPTLKDFVDNFRRMNVRSYVASGFVRKEPWVISLVAATRHPRAWTEYDRDLMKSVAQSVWPLVERARSEAALRASESQLRLVTNSAPIFMAYIDRERRFRFVNEPYARRYRRPASEIVGRLVREIVGEPGYAIIEGQLDEAFAGKRFEFELEMPPQAPAPGWIHVSYTPELASEGETVGVLAVITDISARKAADLEIERARDEALAASRAKDDFIAALSHELRTPLNPVLLIASEASENPNVPSDLRRDFSTIRKSVELEARLIDDLLDLTRITKGKLPLERRAVSADAVLQDALSVIHAEAQTKRVTVTLNFQTHGAYVQADPVRLQQVLWNVLKNAVKFTPSGGQITIRTTLDQEGNCWRATFEDTGIGMNEAELRRVFDAFTQGDHAIGGRSHRFGGVGLGLTISRRLVELQGGSIEANSPGPGKGSVFVVELPLTSARTDDEATDTSVLKRSDRADSGLLPECVRRVLVVEDHGPTREALASLLRRRGLEVLTAGTLGEARERAVLGNIALVVSDIGLPDGDGCELMEELQRKHGLKGIALTGYGREADVARTARAGFVAHLTKPIRVQALDAVLAKVWSSTVVA